MKILISHLPKHDWWGHGTPIYKNNPAMKQGMVPNQELVEIIELPAHPWFVACQFHPEFKSRPRGGHPLFSSYIQAALAVSRQCGDAA